MGDVSVTILALASLLLFLLSSTQVAHRIRGRLGGITRRLIVHELDGIPTRVIGGIAPLIAAASQIPVAYVLLFREHELSLVASVVLLLELYVAAGWMGSLAEVRRHLREAAAHYEEQRRLARMLSGYRR